MVKVNEIKVLRSRLIAVTQQFTKARDELRSIIADAEELEDGLDDNIQDLERIADNLSQYV